MAEVRLPVVSGDLNPQQALEQMRSLKRSGIVVQIGKNHALLRAPQVANAIAQKVQRMENVEGFRKLARSVRGVTNPHLALLEVDSFGATLWVHDKWLPVFESSPQICKCEDGHDGEEGKPCDDIDCGKIVTCRKL